MKRLFIIGIFITLAMNVFSGCSSKPEMDIESEKVVIKKVVEDCIGWALTKDIDLLYSIVLQDEEFHIVNPDSNRINGFKAFKAHAERIWLNDAFKATHFEVKELKINLSNSGTTAWFFCYLDDFYEWNGVPGRWENVRWTGTLEKINGKWIHVQMHFSFPTG